MKITEKWTAAGLLENKKVKVLLNLLILGLVILGGSFFLETIFVKNRETKAETEEPITLELTYAYQNPQWNAAIEEIIHAFEEEYPDIDIQYSPSYEDTVYENILSTRIARNELGDLVQLKTPGAYVRSGLLGTITDDVSGMVSYRYAEEDKTYGVGMVESTWGILYNVDYFNELGLEPPETYDDFLEICDALKEKDITPIGVGGGELWHMEFWVNHFFRTEIIAEDPEWLTKCCEGEVSWTDENVEQMIRKLCNLFWDDNVNDNWSSTTDAEASYMLADGSVAMLYTGPWTINVVKQQNPDTNFGWFYVPDEEGTTVAADNQDTYWAVTASCQQDEERYEAAMTFLNFFYSQDLYGTLCSETLNFPVTQSDSQEQASQEEAEIKAVFDEADLQIQVYIGNEDTPERFESQMLTTVKQILQGTMSVKNGLAQIQESWDQCLEQGGVDDEP